MSSDGYLDDLELDEAAFRDLDAIASAHFDPQPQHHEQLEEADQFGDMSFELDEQMLQKIDRDIEESYTKSAAPKSSTSGLVQTTLFGDILHNPPSNNTGSSRTFSKSLSSRSNPSGQKKAKIKQWDHTAFAKSGFKLAKKKGKRGDHNYSDEEEWSDDEVEFEQFPAPFVPVGPPPPMKLAPDPLEMKHWIYPLNHPKRAYQFNIARKCLFENTIVALPTGLGKTFIAGVVMLNFYRWFPQGKIVFLAPTKPLVAQQIEACHNTCGIRSSDSQELTGEIPMETRRVAWSSHRVFFMTPQTLLNDLIKDVVDAQDLVLIVIDEAHKATGDYAYNQIVRFMMAKNPHFRILALTATPGSKPDAVQDLINNLHISHIEIRDENSLDLKDYLHEKNIEEHVIRMSEEVNRIKDLLVRYMDAINQPLVRARIMYNQNPVKMSPFFIRNRTNLVGSNKWAFTSLSKLGRMARIMGYLLEGTITMCYSAMAEIRDSAEKGRNQQQAARDKKIVSDPLFKAVMTELEAQKAAGFSMHPKTERLISILVQFFGKQMDGPAVSKGIVYVTNREAVEDVVEVLNAQRPLIRATKFVGRGSDKKGNKGMSQKAQLQAMKQFRRGEYNIIVSTVVGEEGLDIGEVDIIVCYDVPKTSVRMLQRIGRTGRRRDGSVHLLMAEGREEDNPEKAKDTYKQVQKAIVRGDQLEFYGDVGRLLPEHVKPQCFEQTMEIHPWVREEMLPRMRSEASTTAGSGKGKRKRNDDIMRNIPPGASTGFVQAGELVPRGSKKAKKQPFKLPKTFEAAGQDDSDDAEIEAGVVTQRSASTSALPSSKRKPHGKTIRKAPTMDPKPRAKRTTKRPEAKLSASEFKARGIDDSDDLLIERTIVSNPQPSNYKVIADIHTEVQDRDARVKDVSVLDLTDSDCEDDEPLANKQGLGAASHFPTRSDRVDDMAWLIDGDDDLEFGIIESSPANKTLSEETSCLPSASSGASSARPSAPWHLTPESPETRILSRSPQREKSMSSPQPSGDMPSLTVNPHRKKRRRDLVVSSPTEENHHTRRLKRRRSSGASDSVGSCGRQSLERLPMNQNPLLDIAAIHSGDEVSDGASESVDEHADEETSFDREFIKDIPDTQVSPSYRQAIVYRQSLLTQPRGGSGHHPHFQNVPRRGKVTRAESSRRRDGVSSSPPPEQDGDEYHFGSFVVHDDDEIVLASSDV